MAPARPRRLRYARDLVSHLVAREFRLRYRRAVVGWAWAVAEPLARFAILVFVFQRIIRIDRPDYGVFLFTGIIVWNWFSAGLASATSSALERADLLGRPGIPRAVVPLVSVLTDLLDLFAALPVLAVFLVFHDGIPWTALLFPVVLVVLLLLVLGLGFALCSANVYFRDVRLFVTTALLLGFYMTPVFYDVSNVPERYRWVVSVNPVAQVLDASRDVLVEGRVPGGSFAVTALVAAAVFAAGYAIYRAASPAFVDEL